MEKRIQNLSEDLRNIHNRHNLGSKKDMLLEYGLSIFDHMSKINFKDVTEIYKVEAYMQNRKFSFDVSLWEIKFESVQKIEKSSFGIDLWNRETCLVKKLKLDDAMNRALQRHQNKLLGKDTTEQKRDYNLLRRGSKVASTGLFKAAGRILKKPSQKNLAVKPELKNQTSLKPEENSKISQLSIKIKSKDKLPPVIPVKKEKKKGKLAGLMGGFGKKEPAKPGAPEPKKGKKLGKLMNKLKNLKNTNTMDDELSEGVDELPEKYLQDLDSEEEELKYVEEEGNSSELSLDVLRSKDGDLIYQILGKLAKMPKDAIEDMSSIGSNKTSTVAQRDTLKKIKNSIERKSSPKGLVRAVQILTLTMIFCIIINLGSFVVFNNMLKEINLFIDESSELSILNLNYNKITTFLEFEELRKPPFSIDFDRYNSNILEFITKDAKRAVNKTKFLLDKRYGNLSLDRGHVDTLQDYFFDQRQYNIRGFNLTIPVINFMSIAIESINNYVEGEKTKNNRMVYLDNSYEFIKFNHQIREEFFKKSSGLENIIRVISLFDIFLRILAVLLATFIAFPLTYTATQSSGEILVQLAKIGQSNITFYMQHYSKLNLFLKSGVSYQNILPKIQRHFASEFANKQIREQKSGFNRGIKFVKQTENGKLKWILIAIAYGCILILAQGSKAIFIFVFNNKIDRTISSIVKIAGLSNEIAVFNSLSLRLVKLKYLEQTQTDNYKNGYYHLNQVNIFNIRPMFIYKILLKKLEMREKLSLTKLLKTN